MIPFAGNYTRQQWSQGIRLAMYPTGRNLVFRLLGLGLILFLVGVIVYNAYQGEQVSWTRLARPVVSMLLLGAWVSPPYVRAWRTAAQAWRGTGQLGLSGVVTDQGIVSNASSSGQVDRWDRVLRAIVRDDIVVLVEANGMATILPRTFFPSEDHWQRFRQLVQLSVVPPR